MIEVERTRQQLDPVGTLGNRLLAVVLATGAFLYGLVMTFRTMSQVSSVLLAVLALLCLSAASFTVVFATSPQRAPFTRSMHMLVQFLALGSIALSAASQWETNRFIQDDFGSVSLGMLMLALGTYRPALELAGVGTLSAIFIGFLVLLEVPMLDTPVPPVSFVLVGMTPILAMAFASARYSGSLVESLEKWQKRSRDAVTLRTGRLRDGIARSVRGDRVVILSEEVLPYFHSVLEKDRVSAEDRLRARDIADRIRALMVAEADRTWLEVVAGEDGVEAKRIGDSVVDRGGRASRMGADQRTVLRALLIAILEDPSFRNGTLKITITGNAVVNRGVLRAVIDDDGFAVRSTFAPYFAIMRIVFADLLMEYQESVLTLRFSYEQQ